MAQSLEGRPARGNETLWVSLVARLAYGLAAGMAGWLFALVVVIASGPRFNNGEAWEGVVIGLWVFGGPTAAVGAVLSSAAVFPLYRSCRSTLAASALFLLNVCLITAMVLLLGGWVISYAVDAS